MLHPYRDLEFAQLRCKLDVLKVKNEEMEKELNYLRKIEERFRRKEERIFVMGRLRSFLKKPVAVAMIVIMSITSYFFVMGMSWSYITRDYCAQYGEGKCETHPGHWLGTLLWPIGVPLVFGARLASPDERK